MTTSQSGYLLIADITGYTAFLSGSELDHAQETLSTLLELLIEHTRPPLIISRLAGDAVISYALQETVMQGQTLVEMIEDSYVAFRKAIELMVMNNSCQCNACANVSALDLKFFVHYGIFGLQHLSAHDELVGNDVNLIHRLLKNQVTEKTGCRAYTLYTDTAIQRMGLGDMSATMTRHSEAYEHLGEVQVWVQDMHPIWEQKRDSTRITMSSEGIVHQVEADIAMPPHLVWDYLTQPEFRTILVGTHHQEIINRTHGRVGVGTSFQCFHGGRVYPQTILEWQPFDRMLTQELIPIPIDNTFGLVEYRVVETKTGTRLIQTFGSVTGPLLGRILTRILGTILMLRFAQTRIDAFKQYIEDDLARRGGVPPVTVKLSSEVIGEAAASSLTNT